MTFCTKVVHDQGAAMRSCLPERKHPSRTFNLFHNLSYRPSGAIAPLPLSTKKRHQDTPGCGGHLLSSINGLIQNIHLIKKLQHKSELDFPHLRQVSVEHWRTPHHRVVGPAYEPTCPICKFYILFTNKKVSKMGAGCKMGPIRPIQSILKGPKRELDAFSSWAVDITPPFFMYIFSKLTILNAENYFLMYYVFDQKRKRTMFTSNVLEKK